MENAGRPTSHRLLIMNWPLPVMSVTLVRKPMSGLMPHLLASTPQARPSGM